MTLSEAQASRHPVDDVEVFTPLAPGFPQLLKPPSRRAVLPTPVDRFGAVGWHFGALPRRALPEPHGLPGTNGRSASTNFLSRPAQASLTLRPADLLAHLAWTLSRRSIRAFPRRAGSLAIPVYRPLLGVGLSPTDDLRRWGARSFRNFCL